MVELRPIFPQGINVRSLLLLCMLPGGLLFSKAVQSSVTLRTEESDRVLNNEGWGKLSSTTARLR